MHVWPLCVRGLCAWATVCVLRGHGGVTADGDKGGSLDIAELRASLVQTLDVARAWKAKPDPAQMRAENIRKQARAPAAQAGSTERGQYAVSVATTPQ